MPDVYYKFRSMKSFDYVADILVNNRIYLSEFGQLNDPTEGLFEMQNSIGMQEIMERVKERKKQLRIGSLSGDFSDARMWAHYASGHNGVAIGIMPSDEYQPEKVIYGEGMEQLEPGSDPNPELIRRLLTRKFIPWEYEDEYRIVRDTDYAPIAKIVEIIVGMRVSTSNKELLLKMVDAHAPSVQVFQQQLQAYPLRFNRGPRMFTPKQAVSNYEDNMRRFRQADWAEVDDGSAGA